MATRSGTPWRAERFTTGDPDLLDALRSEQAGQPDDLLEGQDLVARQEGEVPAVDLLRHAVGAPEVAAIRDRDPQVVESSAEPVDHRRGRILELQSAGVHSGMVQAPVDGSRRRRRAPRRRASGWRRSRIARWASIPWPAGAGTTRDRAPRHPVTRVNDGR